MSQVNIKIVSGNQVLNSYSAGPGNPAVFNAVNGAQVQLPGGQVLKAVRVYNNLVIKDANNEEIATITDYFSSNMSFAGQGESGGYQFYDRGGDVVSEMTDGREVVLATENHSFAKVGLYDTNNALYDTSSVADGSSSSPGVLGLLGGALALGGIAAAIGGGSSDDDSGDKPDSNSNTDTGNNGNTGNTGGNGNGNNGGNTGNGGNNTDDGTVNGTPKEVNEVVATTGYDNGHKVFKIQKQVVGHDGATKEQDSSFGDGGSITIDSKDGEFITDIQMTDKHIIVAGYTQNKDGTTSFLVKRYDSDGSLDTDFGENGIVTLKYLGQQNMATGVDVDDKGNIVFTGISFNGSYEKGSEPDSYHIVETPKPTGDTDVVVMRLDKDGNQDTEFGGNRYSAGHFISEAEKGVVAVNTGPGNALPTAINIDEKGITVVGGTDIRSGTESANSNAFIVRLHPGGHFDYGFDGHTQTSKSGMPIEDAGDGGNGVVIYYDKRAHDAAKEAQKGSEDKKDDGEEKLDLVTPLRGFDAFYDVIEHDGKLYAVGYKNNGFGDHMLLAEYDDKGSVESDFNKFVHSPSFKGNTLVHGNVYSEGLAFAVGGERDDHPVVAIVNDKGSVVSPNGISTLEGEGSVTNFLGFSGSGKEDLFSSVIIQHSEIDKNAPVQLVGQSKARIVESQEFIQEQVIEAKDVLSSDELLTDAPVATVNQAPVEAHVADATYATDATLINIDDTGSSPII